VTTKCLNLIIAKPMDVPMNDEDVNQFILAFEDFMKHADVEVQNYVQREAARSYTQSYFERQAAEMNVTVDYYISEFV
jgi:hypothetical protein